MRCAASRTTVQVGARYRRQSSNADSREDDGPGIEADAGGAHISLEPLS